MNWDNVNNLKEKQKCPECEGEGWSKTELRELCRRCRGLGWVEE